MGIWEELGLAPTADGRAIKRAYAARLKATRPEDDPAGFQRLRTAYESALAQAARGGPRATPRTVVAATATEAPLQGEAPATDDAAGAPRVRAAQGEPARAEAAGQAPPKPPHREAARLARAVFAKLSGEGEVAAVRHLQELTANALIDLELRELFEPALLEELVRYPERPLLLLAFCFDAFQWGDDRHPLRRRFGNVFAFASHAGPVLEAQNLLRRLAAHEDKRVSNWKALGQAARLLLAAEPPKGFAFWSLSNTVLDALGQLLAELRRRCGDASVLVVSAQVLAFWDNAVRYLPRRSPVRASVLMLVALFALIVIDRNRVLLSGGSFLWLAIGGGLALSFAYRYLRFRYALWRVPDDSPVKQWYTRWFASPANPWLLTGMAAVATLGTLLPDWRLRIACGLAAYYLMARWIDGRERVIVFMVPSLIAAAFLMERLPPDSPYKRLDFIHLCAVFVIYGLWCAATRKSVIRRFWIPVWHAGESRRARPLNLAAFTLLAAGMFVLPETARLAAWVFGLISLGYAINDRGLLLRSAGVALLIVSLPLQGLKASGVPFLTIHLLSTAVAYGLFRVYANLCSRRSWEPHADGFFMGLGVLAFIGGIAAR